MSRIALADDHHLHDRNFPSLFKMMARDKHEVSVLLQKGMDGFGLINCTGNYGDLTGVVPAVLGRALNSWAQDFLHMAPDALYNASVFHLRLWPLCRSEMLAYLLPRDTWQETIALKDDRAIFDKAYAEDRETLALNMGVASYWLNHWLDLRETLFRNHVCCVFSGSMTYTRTLMELLRRSPTRVFVMESTFTGNDYIFEEAYHPVANNLAVKHASVRARRRRPELEEPGQYDREVIKARNKVFEAQNKNVTQPPATALPAFPERRPQVLIAGQVCNDFSLIEDGFPYVGSIPVYRALIEGLLERTDCNIVFKAHPWEHRKVNLKTAKTFEALTRAVLALPVEKRARVLLVEDVNLPALIRDSDHFVTLCSQAAIEAALLGGLRPVVVGQAFYSGAGFTTDCADVEAAVEAVRSGPGLLDLDGFKALDRFLVDLLQNGTVSVNNSGINRTAEMLVRRAPIPQKTPTQEELSLNGTAPGQPLSVAEWSPVLRQKPRLSDAALLKAHGPHLDLRLLEPPATLAAGGDALRLPIDIVNRGTQALPAQFGATKAVLSYHIFDADGARYVWNGEQSPLTGDVHDTVHGKLSVLPPEDPGEYRLVPAILYPGLCWIEGAEGWEFRVE